MEQYLENTLFGQERVCNFYDEVIIDNIPCHITLKHIEDGTMRLILHNTNIHKKLGELLNDEDDEYLYNLMDEPVMFQMCAHMPISQRSRYVMDRLNTIIRDIRFSKIHGKFLHKTNTQYTSIKDTIQVFFKDNENIQFKKSDDEEKCCICYEETLTTGSCTHPVCIPCAMNIKPDLENDQLCPICRDVLLFV